MSGGLVLITRPRPQAEETARDIEALGHATLIEPLLDIHSLEFTVPGRAYGGVILTSVQAVRALKRTGVRADIPVFVVGEQVAEALKAEGFGNIAAVAPAAQVLAEQLEVGYTPYLYLCGLDTAFPMREYLDGKGIACEVVPVYEAVAARGFSEACAAALRDGQVRAVTLFSARSARIFCDLYAPFARRDIKLLCFGNSVLECVRSYKYIGDFSNTYGCEARREEFLSLVRTAL